MTKFSFFIGFILVVSAISAIPSSWQRWIMGLSGIALVLFATYIKFYLFDERRNRETEKRNYDEDKPSIDLEANKEKGE